MADNESTAIASAPARGVEVEQLPRGDFFRQVAKGIGISSGLLLLWVMETGRNGFFWLLDRLHVPAHRRAHGSAFPPDAHHR